MCIIDKIPSLAVDVPEVHLVDGQQCENSYAVFQSFMIFFLYRVPH